MAKHKGKQTLRRCRECRHDPGSDRLCLVGLRHATTGPKHCTQWQPLDIYTVPEWLK